jgi:hypothetical protein
VPSNPERRPPAKAESAADVTADVPEARKAVLACDGILESIPTAFGKLVTLAGLGAKDSGTYSHPQLDALFPRAVVSVVLQRRHETVFAEWLNLSLEEQHKQLTEFFCTMWTEGTPRLPVAVREALVPATAREAERMLFLADLECMLSVMEVQES